MVGTLIDFLIGCVPTFGSAAKGTCKVALKGGKGTSKDKLLAVLREGIKVSAGEDIGYMGLHEYSNDAIRTKKDDNRVHIEMFSFEEPPEFSKNRFLPIMRKKIHWLFSMESIVAVSLI